MSHPSSIVVEFPGPDDAGPIEEIQSSWIGARVGSEGFLLCPETPERLREMIRDGRILVARLDGEVVSYITFYRRDDWERSHPGYSRKLDYATAKLRAAHENADYVLIDHIARKKSYTGDAAVRLVAWLRKLLGEWGIGVFLGEIHPDNRRSAAFFTRALRAVRIGTTTRDGNTWDIYAARR